MNKIRNAAFATSSKEYFPYAKTLRDSFKKHNPNVDFFFVLVDEVDDLFLKENSDCELIEVKDIGIKDFKSLSFKYDVVELNTAVKYSFMKYLKKTKTYEKVMYIDSDIRIYNNLDFIYKLLDDHSFILTPHITQPYQDQLKPNQQDITKGGTHNLGWVAVGNSEESDRYLDWAESFCMKIAFDEPRNGLFTDQKQQDLAFTLFDNGYLLKDKGCNMAYWNLHERTLTYRDNCYYVNNNETPLSFYHFSGLNVYSDIEISTFQNRYDLKTRPDLFNLFNDYRKELLDNGYTLHKEFLYVYDYYNNGEKITDLARRIYAANLDKFSQDSIFHTNGNFYKWAKKMRLLDTSPKIKEANTMTINNEDKRIRIINGFLRIILRIVGANKYSSLMKYFSYISVLRNQKNIFK